MTPERLASFIAKSPLGAATLTMVHEQAMGGGITVASYSKEEIEQLTSNNHSVSDELAALAKDHCDSTGESCRFLVQWMAASGVRPLRTLVHKEVPSAKPTDEMGQHAMRGDAVSMNAMVGQLLNHIHQQQKVLCGSIGAVFAAYERGMLMQERTITELHSMLNRTQEQLEELSADTEAPVDTELAALKRRSLEKLLEMAPHMVGTATQLVAHKLAGPRPANDNAQALERRTAAGTRAVEVERGQVDDDDDDDDDSADQQGAQGTA